MVPCSEVTGINEKDNGFLGSGPISSHLLTARPRGRIYSPPGDHNHPSSLCFVLKQRYPRTQFPLHWHRIFLKIDSLQHSLFLTFFSRQLFSTVSSHWEVIFKVWCIGGADKKTKDQQCVLRILSPKLCSYFVLFMQAYVFLCEMYEPDVQPFILHLLHSSELNQ